MKSSILLLSIFINSLCWTESFAKTYRAAVLDHVPQPFTTPSKTLLANAEIYAQQAKIAADQGAKVIVFPEYGLFGVNITDDEWDRYIPDLLVYLPQSADGWIPCTNPDRFSHDADQKELLRLLSCAAKNNSIFMLVNTLLKEPCNPVDAPKCPSDGMFKFNANLIFAKNGTLLARYRKYKLFDEEPMESAPEPEVVIVEIDSIKFGTFICFDIMFDKPAIDYVKEHGVRNILFATAWINELPFITAPQGYSRFARGLGINLLVSNVYDPYTNHLGSGIYSTHGAINETYDIPTPGRLLLADLPVDPNPLPEELFTCESSPYNETIIRVPYVHQWNYTLTDLPSSIPAEKIHKIYHQSLKNFSTLILNANEANVSICQGDLCCRLVYRKSGNDTIYVLAVLNGLHVLPGAIQPYVQLCSVLHCESTDVESCGRVPKKPTNVRFTEMSLSGSFMTSTVFPSIIRTDLHSVRDNLWTYVRGNCTEGTKFLYGARMDLKSEGESILVASLYGRMYERDEVW